MKRILFWLGMLIGMVLALLVTDPAKTGGKPRKAPRLSDIRWSAALDERLDQAAQDWTVRMHLTDLNEEEARDYQGLLSEKFADEFEEGKIFVTIWREDGHENHGS